MDVEEPDNTGSERFENSAEIPGREDLDKLAISWTRRSGGLAKLMIGLAGAHGGDPILWLFADDERKDKLKLRSIERASEDLAMFLSRYKGAMMKIGQMLSYVELMELPESARGLLSGLQTTSTPMSAGAIEQVVRTDLGDIPQRVFFKWSPRPFAAASIGQVHEAKLSDNTRVAVKVQYPDVEEAIRSDLKNASLLAAVMQPIAGEIDPITTAREIKQRLLEECDYRLEAANQEQFADWFTEDREIHIPRVFREYSSKHILTTRYSDGERFDEFCSGASQVRKNRAGLIIFRMAFTSILKHGAFNCDPHPGNYLFRSTGVDFVDFGCVRRFSPEFMTRWLGLMRSVVENDRHAHRVYLDALHVSPKHPDRHQFDYEHHMRVSRYLYRPWLTDQPFRYTPEYVKESFSLLVHNNPNRNHMRLPAEFVFVNRLQWGMNSVLAALRAENRWADVILPLLYNDETHFPVLAQSPDPGPP